jgi:hypothetical protein
MESIHKFGFLNPEELPYEYPNIWAIEETSGPGRLAIAPGRNQIEMLLKLTKAMPEPFGVLYVLTLGRSDSEPGRYQCAEPKSRQEIESFLIEFKQFFEEDGRHHLWIRSESGLDLLVYDRHNKIYAYGALEEFANIASAAGLTPAPAIQIPMPHVHHYHPKHDQDGVKLMQYWEWLHTPLRESDEE